MATVMSGLLSRQVADAVRPGRVWLLLGARRIGKTVLVERFIKESSHRWFKWHGKDAAMRDLLESKSAERYRQVFTDYDDC